MKVQSSSRIGRYKVQGCGTLLPAIFALFAVYYLLFTNTAAADGKWSGVDESIVEKAAKEHGREPREPFINTDQGDLLLFVFLLGGAFGGFISGYCWRALMVEKSPKVDSKEQKITN